MIFYTSDRPLTKQEVSEKPWLTQWNSYTPKSHTELAELLSSPTVHGCSLGDVSNKNLTPKRISTTAKARENDFTRSKRVIDSTTNVILLDIELSSVLEGSIKPPLNSLKKVEDFIKSLGFKSYIIGRSSSAITKKHYNKWHVYALFNTNVNMKNVSNFLQHRVPKDSWYEGLTSSGKVLIKNSYLDTSVFDISRLVYEHPNVKFKVVDNGLNNSSQINASTKPFKPNPFNIKKVYTEQERLIRELNFKKTKTASELHNIKKGFFEPDTLLMLSDGQYATAQEIVDDNKDIRLSSLIDDYANISMAYYASSQTFIDWHDGAKRYKVSTSKNRHIEYDTQYLPPLSIPHENTFILAPTGSGKTTAIMKYFKGQKTIMIVPKRAIVSDLDGLTSGFASWKDLSLTEVNVMTYDKLRGHLNNGKDISEFNIIIDEIHTVFNSYSDKVRKDIYDFLLLRKKEFKKLILLSATMDPAVLPVQNLHSYMYKNVSKTTHIKFIKNAYDLTHYIKGRTLIFLQSTMKNASIFDVLSQKYSVLNLKSGSHIPSDVSDYDIIVTTSVLREGFSITSQIDTVIVFNVHNASGSYDIIQSIARPRVSNPDVYVISASTHFNDINVYMPTVADLTQLAYEVLKGYTPEDIKLLHAINLERFKTYCLTVDEDDNPVVNHLGILSFYLDLLKRKEVTDFEFMTNNMKEFLNCTTELVIEDNETCELPKITIQELQNRLRGCKTFKELDKVIDILENYEEFGAQCKELLSKIQDTVPFIDTQKGLYYLTEEQQVQYKVNPAVFSKINQHRRNISEGVYDKLLTSRAWRYNDTFELRGLKRIFKVLDKKRKKFSDEEVLSILKKVCRFEKVTKEGVKVYRGHFDYIRVTHKTLIDLETTPIDTKAPKVKGI